MFSKFTNWLKEMYRKVIPYKNIKQAINVQANISQPMSEAIQLWESMYNDNSPWLSESKGIYSLNIAATVCSELARSITLEMKMNIAEPGTEADDTEDSKPLDTGTRAGFLNDVCQKGIIDVIREKLEYGAATGGLIIKPYINNGKLYFDYNAQGEFLPIAFDDDGRIIEIAFIDSYNEGEYRYTKIEYHKFDRNTNSVTIKNTAYRTDINSSSSEIGTLINLANTSRWSTIPPEITVNNTDRPLYGFYKVAKANNIDKHSPLGVSAFSRATKIIQKADEQFSRLDWEFKGGEMAIDVDTTSIPKDKDGYEIYPEGKQRLYRKVDLGTEQTYNVFNPTLRDGSYIAGLTTYLKRVEDLCELHRGALSDDNTDVNYSNELHLIITEQRAFRNTIANQQALQTALEDVIYVANLYTTLYNLAPEGEYEVNFDWDDNVVNDTHTQLEERLSLVDAGAMSKAEVRAWYLGESEKTANEKIKEITAEKDKEMESKKLLDLFNPTLEQ